MGRWARGRVAHGRSRGRFPGARPRGALLALVLDGALEVDLALLALAHELLEHGLEPRVAPPAGARGGRILEGLDREVDLAVLLDGDDLRLDDVALPEVLVDVLDVVPVDLGDVHEPDLAPFQGQEGPVRGDARHGPVDDRANLEISDLGSFQQPGGQFSTPQTSGERPLSHPLDCSVKHPRGWEEVGREGALGAGQGSGSGSGWCWGSGKQEGEVDRIGSGRVWSGQVWSGQVRCTCTPLG